MQKNNGNNKPRALTDYAYEYIKDQILNLEIPPGSQIDIEAYAEKLDVSRTPVREAFLRLAAEGLIEIHPRVGYFVVDITEQDIRDLFEIREIIESRAARRAAETLTDEELDECVKLMEASKLAVKNKDYKTYLRNEITFHNIIQRHMKNKRLIDFISEMNNLTYRERIMSIQSIENIEQTLVEHERILGALVTRDSDRAAWFMGEHLKNVSNRLIVQLRSTIE